MKTRSAKVQELIGLALKVNAQTKYCTFVNFSGHVDSISIRVTSSKKSYNDQLLLSEFYLDRGNEERFNDRYERCKSVLVNILKTGKINYDHEGIVKEERVEYDYKF